MSLSLDPSKIQLRFVPLNSLLLHEEHDPCRVKRLEIALQKEGMLRNPPIVSTCGETFVVLDGATRISAMRRMGFRDSLVQIVKYDPQQVQLNSWCHVIVGPSLNWLLSEINHIDQIKVQPATSARAAEMLSTRQALARIVAQDGREIVLLGSRNTLQRASLLRKFVGIYRGRAEVHRTIAIDIPTLAREFPGLIACVDFPAFQPEEIMEITMNGERLPMGISRHIILGRALGLNIPLCQFEDSIPIEEKNVWLEDRILKSLRANQIRLYLEPVFIFDE